MASRPSHPAPAPSESRLATFLITLVIVLVAALVYGGYWLQQQRSDAAAQRAQADTYRRYLNSTPATPERVDMPRSYIEAQQVRQQLLAHPAVTPGPGFDKPGVQSTGKAIVDAMEQAQRF